MRDALRLRGIRLGERPGCQSDFPTAVLPDVVNERGLPFGRMGVARMIERAGEVAGLPFPIHVHMLRHSTGYALGSPRMDTRRLPFKAPL